MNWYYVETSKYVFMHDFFINYKQNLESQFYVWSIFYKFWYDKTKKILSFSKFHS